MDKGCETPLDAETKNRYIALAQMYAPIVLFDTRERFFPVDLASTFAKSRLYRIIGDRTREANNELVSSHPTLVDMASANDNYFTTVDRWRPVPNTVSEPPFSMPAPWDPDLDTIYQKYASGAIDARLTTYATVCKPREVPNYRDYLDQHSLRDKTVWLALQEGLLINYYFFFPALKAPELRREGDWGGISVLIPHDAPEISFPPALYCFYKKMREPRTGLEGFGPGDEGFRTVKQVENKTSANEDVRRRCLVYVSLGRHNCYAHPPPYNTQVKSGIPWGADPKKVESGAYRSIPGIKSTVTSDTDWGWTLGFLFPWLFGLLCPARGKKTKHTVYQDVNDEMRSMTPGLSPVAEGPNITSTYPSGDWGHSERQLQVKYVDTQD